MHAVGVNILKATDTKRSNQTGYRQARKWYLDAPHEPYRYLQGPQTMVQLLPARMVFQERAGRMVILTGMVLTII